MNHGAFHTSVHETKRAHETLINVQTELKYQRRRYPLNYGSTRVPPVPTIDKHGCCLNMTTSNTCIRKGGRPGKGIDFFFANSDSLYRLWIRWNAPGADNAYILSWGTKRFDCEKIRHSAKHTLSWLCGVCPQCNEQCPRAGAECVRHDRKSIERPYDVCLSVFVVVVRFFVPCPWTYDASAAATFIADQQCWFLCKIEFRKSGVCAFVQRDWNLTYMEGMFGLSYIRVGERSTLVEFVLAFRSETRTRRVVGEQRVHDKAQVAGGHLTLLTTVCAWGLSLKGIAEGFPKVFVDWLSDVGGHGGQREIIHTRIKQHVIREAGWDSSAYNSQHIKGHLECSFLI